MMRLSSATCVAVLSLSVSVPPAASQETSQSPAHISVVDGVVVLERDGRPESAPASMPLLAGDRLRTERGRAEVLFVDASTLHLDADTTVDFQSDEMIRLLRGRVRVTIPGPSRAVSYRIDAPSAWVQIGQPGDYRVALIGGEGDADVELAVLRGAAELVNEDGRTPLRAGERAFARLGAAPSQAYVFNSAAWDDFDRWSEARHADRRATSAEYLPEPVQPYAVTFARYGTWRHESAYGYVWYPTVRVGWRPYFYGRWATLRPYGWTWIGHDPWAWPTHHYGRWGFSAGSWFWIPGRHWGPAWVSWAYAPGYVSWCPLGWNNRPVFGFVNVNVYGGRRYDPWHAWTVIPRHRFGYGAVNVNVVNVTRIDARTRNAFVVAGRPPEVRGYAVPRASAPIRVAGARSLPPVGVSPARRADWGSAPLARPGLPPPVREPRTSTIVRTPPRSVPSDRAAGAFSPADARAERRAVPRQAPTSVPGDAAERPRMPQYRGVPAPARVPIAETPSAPVPETSGRSRYEGDYRAGSRAVPRSAPPDSPQPGYRVPAGERRSPDAAAPPTSPYRGGFERRGPSSAAPAGAPSSATRPPNAPAARPDRGGGPAARPDRGGAPAPQPAARPRGGQPASGTARPRGGG